MPTRAAADSVSPATVLRIAGEVRAAIAAGRTICNLTVGDFDPGQFPIPAELRLKRPLDIPPALAEQELTAGYMTEYSGMKFALFMMAEYLGMFAVSEVLRFALALWNEDLTALEIRCAALPEGAPPRNFGRVETPHLLTAARKADPKGWVHKTVPLQPVADAAVLAAE